MFHEMLTGIPPFEGADVPALMYAVVHHPAPAPSAINGNVPPVLDLIVAKALAKAPEERYADAAEMARDLRSAIAAPPTATAPSVATVGAEKTLPLRDTMRPAPQATSRAPLVPPVAATSGLAKAFDSSLAFERLREGSARGLQPRVPSTARRAYTGRERLVLGVGVTLAVLVALGIAAH
jgi:serine/threonine-protein kinase